ncbi:hypothetical protein MKW92_015341 [Papaver armeniacum]|nr:hypothetical protein MKW92_015341 [Papaver armeniacum]
MDLENGQNDQFLEGDGETPREICGGGNLYDRDSDGSTRPFSGIMHRDMKPQNLLLVNEIEDSVLKVSDFGMSVCFEPWEKFNGVVGDIHHLAPEIISKNYGPEADIWSAGVILYTMLSGYNPWSGYTWEDTGRLILKGEARKKLIRKVLVHDPSKRLTAQQILVHPWLRMNTNK